MQPGTGAWERSGTKRDPVGFTGSRKAPQNVQRRVQITACFFAAFIHWPEDVIPLAETPPSVTTSGRRYNLIAKSRFFWNILPRLSSKTSLILLPNKCLQWNFHFFSFSWGHLERSWFFNKYINTQVLLLSVKVFLTQLLTCQYFCWTFPLPFATHIQTHRWTFHPVTALTAD